MVYIDAHCHLDFYKDEEIKEIVERAKKAKVNIIINNGVNPEKNKKTLKIAEKYPEVKSSLGLYPIDALAMTDNEINSEIEFIRKNKDKLIAIGEIGLDWKEDEQHHERQIEIFKKLINLAKELRKPIIVHSRKAEKEAIETLEELKAKKVIMHCFSGNLKLIDRTINNGWTLTIPTSVKHAEHFQLMIKRAPIEQLLCETDSPYLHPDKLRDNEPANVIESYKKIAEIKELKLKEVEKKLEENYRKLFE